MFSTHWTSGGFNSGEYGGKGSRLMLSGTTRPPPGRCQPAPSSVTTAWAPSHLETVLGQVQVHCRNVDAWQHEGCADAACRTDRTEQIGGGVALIMWCPRPAADDQCRSEDPRAVCRHPLPGR